ncbi:hypothetical protein LQV05_005563 [Cryptococcus neoformans]|nr:hypothetical protein J007_04275 [Cryptococcus neoformans var. grubii]OXC60170.1 hypothetical protein C358_04389 [Cryptococcus neoformans var. grubii MW-RSA852]UOH82851.1 hypothetical protein LQV05_005563 [Cryptococcus neoformans]
MRSMRVITPVIRRPAPLRHIPLITRPAAIPFSRSLSNLPRTPFSSPANLTDATTSEYTHSTLYAFSYLSRTIKYVLYSLLAIGGISVATFEGVHLYVEKVCLAAPSREDTDEYGWASENQGWTGGPRGGTDPRLGMKARHALRGAWICQEWGAGSSGAVERSVHTSAFHPDFVAARSMISVPSDSDEGAANRGRLRVDRGYELADEYVDLAIREARKKGLVFPPTLPGARPEGPPTEKQTSHGPQGDPAVLDLLLLKAGMLERINTIDSLSHAKDLYEQVLCSLDSSMGNEVGPGGRARVMRLAGKVGDLCARTGGRNEALQWWGWGLDKAGVDIHAHTQTSKIVQEVKQGTKKGWLGKSAAASTPAPVTIASTTTISPTLPPPVLRATISLLTSASAQLATTSSLPAASSLQSLALSYLSNPLLRTQDSLASPSAALHNTWLTHRTSLLKLHLSSVLYALSKSSAEALPLVAGAQEQVERVITELLPLPAAFIQRGSALTAPAKILARDALLTGAEIAYTKGTFLERSLPASSSQTGGLLKVKRSETPEEKAMRISTLESALECFERATALSALESGAGPVKAKGGEEEAVGRGEEWGKYWRGFVRIRQKLDEALGIEQVKESEKISEKI